jgi:hypothetical protein
VSRTTGAAFGTYADPACTEPLAPMPSTCATAPPPEYVLGFSGTPTPCSLPAFDSVRRAEPVPAGRRYRLVAGVCTEVPDDPAVELRPGEVVSFDVFPMVEQRIE